MTSVQNHLLLLSGSKIFFMKAIFSLVLITVPLLVCAQRSGNPQKAYLSGKDFYNTDQYHMAMESFKSLSTYNNTFVEYATFYYGLSAYYNGQEEIGKNILLQLSRKYPNWDKRHEVSFWLGKLYFEKGDYVSAVDHLSKIDNASMTSDITNLKLHHLKNAPADISPALLHLALTRDYAMRSNEAFPLRKRLRLFSAMAFGHF